MKRIFGLVLLAALLSAGSLSIAGDKPSSQSGTSCGPCPACPFPCGTCG